MSWSFYLKCYYYTLFCKCYIELLLKRWTKSMFHTFQHLVEVVKIPTETYSLYPQKKLWMFLVHFHVYLMRVSEEREGDSSEKSERTISIQETVRTKSDRAEHKSYKVVQKHDKVWTKSKSEKSEESKNTVYKKKSEGTKSFLSFSCTTFFWPASVTSVCRERDAEKDFQMLFASISFSLPNFLSTHMTLWFRHTFCLSRKRKWRETVCDSNLTASVHWECRTRYLCKEKTTKRKRHSFCRSEIEAWSLMKRRERKELFSRYITQKQEEKSQTTQELYSIHGYRTL